MKNKKNFIRKLHNYIYDLIKKVGIKNQKGNEFRSFLKALVLGIQDNNFFNIKKKFVSLGISHLIVISGLHLSLIYISVRIILKIIFSLAFLITGLSFNSFLLMEWITLFIVFLYKLVLPETIPIQRAFIMLFSYSISKILPFKINAFSVFVLSIFLIVFSYPPSLYMPSFYLSFISVFALISFQEIKIQDRGNFFILYIYKMLIASILIFVFSFAINLFLFKSVSPAALFLNLIFIPLTFFLIIMIILNFIFYELIGFFSLEKLMELFFKFIDYFYSRNNIFFVVDELSLYEVILYLTGIFLISNAIIFKKDSFL